MTELRARRPRTAFVLGGGGNLGAVQVGMLRALIERAIVPDVVIGCSVGAINGAAVARDPTVDGIKRLAAAWRDPETWQVFGGRVTPLALFRKSPSLVGSERLHGLVERWIGDRRLDELDVPLHVVATSLITGRERWLSTGPALPAILASAALPAVLPPVEYDGDVLIDGGVVDNVPMSKALALGAERIVVLHVGNFAKPRPRPKRPIDVLLHAFSIARNHRFAAELDAVAEQADLVVLPSVDPGAIRRNDFTRSGELMERAYTAACIHLDGHAIAAGA